MTIPEMIEMLDKKLAAIEAYEKGFHGVLVGENTVLRLPAGFVKINRIDPRIDPKAKPRATIVDLPNATMFSPITFSVVQKDVHDGFGSTPIAMNFRDAIAHEKQRTGEMIEALRACVRIGEDAEVNDFGDVTVTHWDNDDIKKNAIGGVRKRGNTIVGGGMSRKGEK